jgi:hypothetical protein
MSTTITYDDVVDLMSAASLNDYRTVGEREAELWLAIAVRERWTPAAAMNVVIEYASHGAHRPRITPAAISDALRAARRQAAQAFVPPVIPPGLPNSDYPAWYRRQLAEFVDAAVEAWAQGEDLPREAVGSGPPHLAISEAPPALRAEVERDLARIGNGPRPAPARQRPSPLDLDPHRRAEARAQLDAIRPVSDQQGQDSA